MDEKTENIVTEVVEETPTPVELNPLTERIEYLSDSLVTLEATAKEFDSSGISNVKFKKDRRLKIYLKLDKDTTEQFQNVAGIFKKAGVSKDDDEIAKILFTTGIHATIDRFQQELDNLEKHLESSEALAADSNEDSD